MLSNGYRDVTFFLSYNFPFKNVTKNQFILSQNYDKLYTETTRKKNNQFQSDRTFASLYFIILFGNEKNGLMNTMSAVDYYNCIINSIIFIENDNEKLSDDYDSDYSDDNN